MIINDPQTMKEVGFFQKTLARWAWFFFGFSLFGQVLSQFDQNFFLHSAFELYLGSLLFALLLPLLRSRRMKRKFFIQDIPVTEE